MSLSPTLTKINSAITAALGTSSRMLELPYTTFAPKITDSGFVQELFTQYFPGGIRMTIAAGTQLLSDTHLTLAGTTSGSLLLPNGLPITFTFTKDGDVVGFAASQSDPLPYTPIITFKTISLAFTWKNAAHSKITGQNGTFQGHFTATWDTSKLTQLKTLIPAIGATTNVSIDFGLEKQEDGLYHPYASCQAATGLAFKWNNSLQVKDVVVSGKISAGHDFKKTPITWLAIPSSVSVGIEGKVEFETIGKAMLLSSAFTSDSSTLTFTGKVVELADENHETALTFADMGVLCEGAPVHSTVPSGIPFISELGLEDFSVGFNIAKSPHLQYFHLHVGTASTASTALPAFQGWEIIPGIIKLDELDFFFDLDRQGSALAVGARFSSDFKIETVPPATFNIGGSYPSMIFQAHSTWKSGAGNEPKLADLLTAGFASSPDVVNPFSDSSVTVKEVSFTIDPKSKKYSASLTVDHVLTIDFPAPVSGFGLSINSLKFMVQHNQGAMTGSFYGTASLGNLVKGTGSNTALNLYMSAEVEKDKYTFEGGLVDTFKLDFTTLLSHFWPSLTIPLPELDIRELRMGFSKPKTAGGGASSWWFGMLIAWKIPTIIAKEIPGHSGQGDDLTITAMMQLNREGTTTSGGINTTLDYHGIDLGFGVDFHKDNGQADLTYNASINIDNDIIVSGTYDSATGQASLTFDKMPSLGQILDFLVKAVFPNENIVLPDPWDLLYDIKLPEGTTFDYNFKSKEIGVKITDLDFDIVILKLNSISVSYLPGPSPTGGKRTPASQKKLMIELDGEVLGQSFNPNWNALNPDSAPKAPSKQKLFELAYLGLGQHVEPDLSKINTVSQAINQLGTAFEKSSDGGKPLDGTKLRYNKGAGWLVGANFTLMDIFELGFVFDDPVLYGFSIGVKSKPSAKPFGGLRFEIMYKKVNATTGVYYIYFCLPTIFRHLQFGEVSVTLPNLKLWVYTDGSFTIDLGFPYHNNWKDSFGLQVFPFLGKGGFYFGVLKGKDVSFLPNTHGNGSFDPVIILGIALRVGVGKTINEGILSAGVSVTVAGIMQGFLTFYHPKNDGSKSLYFGLSGQLALIGKLFGSVSFAIISARVDITVYVGAKVTFVLYQPIKLNLHAYVTVKLTVSIHLIFTIHVHLSFHASIALNFTIGKPYTAPWDKPAVGGSGNTMLMTMLQSTLGKNLPQAPYQPPTWIVPTGWTKQSLKLLFSPHYSVDEAGTGVAIAMLHIPIVPVAGNDLINNHYLAAGDFMSYMQNTDDMFVRFAGSAASWLFASYLKGQGRNVSAANLMGQRVSVSDLSNIKSFFSTGNPLPFEWNDLQTWLEGMFNLEVGLMPAGENHASLFPMLPWLELDVDHGPLVPFYDHEMLTKKDLAVMKAYWSKGEIDYNTEATPGVVGSTTPPDDVSLFSFAEVLFQDYVSMVLKELANRAYQLLQQLDVSLVGETGQTFGELMTDYGYVTANFPDLLLANRDKELDHKAGLQMYIPQHSYTVQKADVAAPGSYALAESIDNILKAQKLVGILTGQDIINANPEVLYHTVWVHETGDVEKPERELLPNVHTGLVITIPACVIPIALPDLTISSLAAQYGQTAINLIQAQITPQTGVTFTPWTKGAAMYFSDPPAQSLRFPLIPSMAIGDLLSRLTERFAFANIAGMGSRFFLHGAQVPLQTSPGVFDLEGLYSVSGQQHSITPSGTIALTNALETGQSWPVVSWDGNDPEGITYTLGAEDNAYLSALTHAQLNYTVALQDDFKETTKGFAITSRVSIKNHDPFCSGTGPVSMWKMNTHVDQILNQLWKNGSTAAPTKMDCYRAFSLNMQVQDSHGTLSPPSAVEYFSGATLLKFQVRKVPMPGSAGGFVPNAYEVHSVSDETIDVLKMMLSYVAAGTNGGVSGVNTGIIDGASVHLMYSDAPVRNNQSVPKNLLSSSTLSSDQNAFSFLRTNFSMLSEETILAGSEDFSITGMCEYLLEAGEAQTGGYYMHFEDPVSKKGLPDTLFSTKDPDAEVFVLLSYVRPPVEVQDIYHFQNYLVTAIDIDQNHDTLHLEWYPPGTPPTTLYYDADLYHEYFLHKEATHPKGCFGFEVTNAAVADSTPLNGSTVGEILTNLFNLVNYGIYTDAGLKNGILHRPIGHAKGKGENNYAVSHQNPNAIPEPAQLTWESTISSTELYDGSGTMPQTLFMGPSSAQNPYRSVGQTIYTEMGFTDVYGNHYPAAHLNGSGATKNVINKAITYNDPLIGLSEWPNLNTRYDVTTADGVALRYAFNALGYLPEAARTTHHLSAPTTPEAAEWVKKAAMGLNHYRDLIYQWNSADVNLAWASTLSNPVTGEKLKLLPNDTASKEALLKYANYCYLFVQGLAKSPILNQQEMVGARVTAGGSTVKTLTLANLIKNRNKIEVTGPKTTLQTFMLANQGLNLALRNCFLNVPEYGPKDNLKGIANLSVLTVKPTVATTVGDVLANLDGMQVLFFAMINRQLGSPGNVVGTTALPANQNYFIPVQKHTVAALTGSSIAAQGIELNPYPADTPEATSWSSALTYVNAGVTTLSYGESFNLPLTNAQVVATEVIPPEQAPVAVTTFTCASTDLKAYTGFDLDTITTLNPGYKGNFNTKWTVFVPTRTVTVPAYASKTAKSPQTAADVATTAKCDLAFLKLLNPSLSAATGTTVWTTQSIKVPDVGYDVSSAISLNTFFGHTYDPLHSIADQFNTTEQILNLFNPQWFDLSSTVAPLVLMPNTVVNWPLVALAGGKTQAAAITDFTCVAELGPNVVSSMDDFAADLGFNAETLCIFNPKAALVVDAAESLLLPASVIKPASPIPFNKVAAWMATNLPLANQKFIKAYYPASAPATPQSTVILPPPTGGTLTRALPGALATDLFELEVALAVWRTGNLPDAAVKAPAAIGFMASSIHPNYKQTEDGGHNQATALHTLGEFAADLETALPDYKLGTTHARLRDQDQSAKELWLVKKAHLELTLTSPSYYAQPPLSNYLLSSKTDGMAVPDLTAWKAGTEYLGDTGIATVTKHFHHVDLETQLKSFLSAIDNFMNPEYAIPARSLEMKAATYWKNEPLAKEYPYTALLRNKYELAGVLSNRLQPVFTGDPAAPLSTINKYRQELLIDLGNAYTIDSTVHMAATGTALAHASLSGKCEATAVESGEYQASSYSLSPATVDLSTASTNLDFTFTARNAKQANNYDLDLDYHVNQLAFNKSEIDIGPVAIPTWDWLTLVHPNHDPATTDIDIPVPLHDFPATPALPEQGFQPKVSQFGQPSNETGQYNLEECKEWFYNFDYKFLEAPQDAIKVGMLTDENGSIPSVHGDVTPQLYDLFHDMTWFHTCYPTLKEAMDKYLLPGPTQDDAKAYTALLSFQYLVGQIQESLQACPIPTPTEQKASLYATLSEQEGSLIDRSKHHYEVIAETTTNAELIPEVNLPEYVIASSSPQTDLKQITTYQKGSSPLDYETGSGISRRSLLFNANPLDIINTQQATGYMYVTRNQEMGNSARAVNPSFFYQSPVVQFKSAIRPLLDPNPELTDLDLTQWEGSTQPSAGLEAYLTAVLDGFFKALLPGAKRQTDEVRITCYYSYQLNDREPMGNLALRPMVPVTLILPSLIHTTGDTFINADPIVSTAEIATRVNGWYTTNDLSHKNGIFMFDVSVFALASKQTLPKLRLRNVFLDWHDK